MKKKKHASKLPSLTRILAYVIFIDIAIMNTFFFACSIFSSICIYGLV